MTPRDVLIDYLLLKAAQQDWHGVADAANDLRELDVRLDGSRLPFNNPPITTRRPMHKKHDKKKKK